MLVFLQILLSSGARSGAVVEAPIVQEAGWAPGPVWTGAKNLFPTRIFFCTIVDRFDLYDLYDL
jgi:hypothetical protein